MRKVAAGGWNDPLDPIRWSGGRGCWFYSLAVGILYTIRLRGFVFWGFSRWWKNTAGSLWETPEKTGTNEENMQGGDAAGGMSPFQSACTALAATIGTGNIAGVATALLSGGPGAIFWMWVSAFLGMATAYGETVLGIRYRKRDRSGGWVAGPMLYMERGLGCRWAGLLYAGLCAAASFGMGSMVQANAISETLEFSFSMPRSSWGPSGAFKRKDHGRGSRGHSGSRGKDGPGVGRDLYGGFGGGAVFVPGKIFPLPLG